MSRYNTNLRLHPAAALSFSHRQGLVDFRMLAIPGSLGRDKYVYLPQVTLPSTSPPLMLRPAESIESKPFPFHS